MSWALKNKSLDMISFGGLWWSACSKGVSLEMVLNFDLKGIAIWNKEKEMIIFLCKLKDRKILPDFGGIFSLKFANHD